MDQDLYKEMMEVACAVTGLARLDPTAMKRFPGLQGAIVQGYAVLRAARMHDEPRSVLPGAEPEEVMAVVDDPVETAGKDEIDAAIQRAEETLKSLTQQHSTEENPDAQHELEEQMHEQREILAHLRKNKAEVKGIGAGI